MDTYARDHTHTQELNKRRFKKKSNDGVAQWRHGHCTAAAMRGRQARAPGERRQTPPRGEEAATWAAALTAEGARCERGAAGNAAARRGRQGGGELAA